MPGGTSQYFGPAPLNVEFAACLGEMERLSRSFGGKLPVMPQQSRFGEVTESRRAVLRTQDRYLLNLDQRALVFIAFARPSCRTRKRTPE